ncbi:hypothetical protein D9M68_740590 [compost metagenome]
MAQREFLRGTHIQQHDASAIEQAEQFVDGHAVQAIPLMNAVGDDFLDLGALVLGIAAQRRQQLSDRPRAQPVQHALAVAPRLHETCSAQVLQMLGRIGHRQSGQLGQALDRTFALGDVLEQYQAMRMPQGLGDFG